MQELVPQKIVPTMNNSWLHFGMQKTAPQELIPQEAVPQEFVPHCDETVFTLQPPAFQFWSTARNLMCDKTFAKYVGHHTHNSQLHADFNYDYIFQQNLHVLNHHETTIRTIMYIWNSPHLDTQQVVPNNEHFKTPI